jgi:hypothetical protein
MGFLGQNLAIGVPMSETITISIRNAFDAITARARVREFARMEGLDVTGQARISLAAYSLTNAKSGGGNQGHLILRGLKDAKRIGIEVICVIPDATNHQFPAETFKNIRWLVDEFTAETLPSNEMQVALVQWAPLPERRLQ